MRASSLTSEYTAFRHAKLQNRAIPDAIISPEDTLGEEERDRLEAQWNQKFRHGGAGRVVIGESGLKVQLLSQSMGDLAALGQVEWETSWILEQWDQPVQIPGRLAAAISEPRQLSLF